MSTKLVKSWPENARKYREKYSPKINEKFVLIDDVFVSSPSTAAFVGGAGISGNEVWQTKDGVKLKEYDLKNWKEEGIHFG